MYHKLGEADLLFVLPSQALPFFKLGWYFLDTLGRFLAIFSPGRQPCNFLFVAHQAFSEEGSTLTGKNLLQKEQILSFQSRPLFRRVTKTVLKELPP